MKISKDYLTKITENFFRVMEEKKISSLSDLERRLGRKGKKLRVNKNSNDYIFIEKEKKSSSFGTKTYTLSYITSDKEIPLEIRVTPGLNYCKIIIKGAEIFPGYTAFDWDSKGNLIQSKILSFKDISQLEIFS